MKIREELAEIIQNRTHSLIADANAFIWLRAEQGTVLQDGRIGGGNFLMALGLFSIINFLGKVYSLLEDPSIAITQEEVEEAKQLVKSVDGLKANKAFELKRVGQINETTSSLKLFAECPYLDSGFSEDELRRVWDGVRNNLSHMIVPYNGITIVVRAGGGKFDAARSDLEIQPAFRKMADGRMHCDVDALSLRIEQVAEWLSKKILANEYSEEALMRILGWARK